MEFKLKRIQKIDPRLKILGLIAFGFIVWNAKIIGLIILFILIMGIVAMFSKESKVGLKNIRPYIAFVIVWTGVKLIVDLCQDSPLGMTNQEAIAGTLVFFLRLTMLSIPALVFVSVDSQIQYCKGLRSILKPFLGQYSWKTALLLSLMIAFVPSGLDTVKKTKQAIQVRRIRVSRIKLFILKYSSIIGRLAMKSEKTAAAIVARDLHQDRYWKGSFSIHSMEWITALIGILCLYGISRI